MAGRFSAARSRPPSAARLPASRVMPPICLPSGWSGVKQGIDKLEIHSLQVPCVTARDPAPLLPPTLIRSELDTNPLFEIDLADETEQFLAAHQGRGGQAWQHLKAIATRLTFLSDLIQAIRSWLGDRTRRRLSRSRRLHQ